VTPRRGVRGLGPGVPGASGDRAPPRGVDVKPLRRRGLPGPWEGPDRSRTGPEAWPGSRIPDPRIPGFPRSPPRGAGEARIPGPEVPEVPDPGDGVPALGGFTSTPRAGALRLRRPGEPGVPRGPPGEVPERPPGGQNPNPRENGVQGPAARG